MPLAPATSQQASIDAAPACAHLLGFADHLASTCCPLSSLTHPCHAIPSADEDTLSLGLITFPSEYLEFVDGEGGLWDPEHPAGSPPPAGKGKANQLRQPSRQPIPGQLPSPLPAAGSSTSWAAEADVEAAMGSEGSGAPNGGGALGRLASFGGAIAAKLSGRSQRSTGAACCWPPLRCPSCIYMLVSLRCRCTRPAIAGHGMHSQNLDRCLLPAAGTGLEEPLLSSALLPPGERPAARQGRAGLQRAACHVSIVARGWGRGPAPDWKRGAVCASADALGCRAGGVSR